MGWKAIDDHFRLRKVGLNLCVKDNQILIGYGAFPDLVVLTTDGAYVSTLHRENRYYPYRRMKQSIISLLDMPSLVTALAKQEDKFDSFVKVYTFADGEIVEKFCEVFEYLLPTHDGEVMYGNTHFLNYDDALNKAISNAEACVTSENEYVRKMRSDLNMVELSLKKYQSDLDGYLALKLERESLETII